MPATANWLKTPLLYGQTESNVKADDMSQELQTKGLQIVWFDPENCYKCSQKLQSIKIMSTHLS